MTYYSHAEIRGIPELTMGVSVARLSPNGRRVAFLRGGYVWIQDVDRGTQNRLTSIDGTVGEPVWSPDGSRIVFRARRGPQQKEGVYQKLVSGTADEELVLESPTAGRALVPLDWSNDGQDLVLGNLASSTFFMTASGGGALTILPLTEPRKLRPYLSAPTGLGQARLSPSGRWLAYEKNESGVTQVFIQSFPDPANYRRQISTDGGLSPRWRRDGRELYFIDGRNRMLAVPLASTDQLEFGPEKFLFEATAATGFREFDVSADGQRFVLPRAIGGNPITVVVNWTANLKK